VRHRRSTDEGDGGLRRPKLRPFVELAYGYLPLVWAGTLAHHSKYFLEEGGHVVQVGRRGASVGLRVLGSTLGPQLERLPTQWGLVLPDGAVDGGSTGKRFFFLGVWAEGAWCC
jgi:hypothetical protein